MLHLACAMYLVSRATRAHPARSMAAIFSDVVQNLQRLVFPHHPVTFVCEPRVNFAALGMTRDYRGRYSSLFVVGTDTTALSLCWAMYYLSKSREALSRCRAEALRTAPSRCVSYFSMEPVDVERLVLRQTVCGNPPPTFVRLMAF